MGLSLRALLRVGPRRHGCLCSKAALLENQGFRTWKPGFPRLQCQWNYG